MEGNAELTALILHAEMEMSTASETYMRGSAGETAEHLREVVWTVGKALTIVRLIQGAEYGSKS